MIAPVDTSKIQIGHLARLQLLGVFVPGILILFEVWLLRNAGDIREDGVLQVASHQLERVNSRVLWPAILILLIAAYVVGLLLRQLTVWIMDTSLPRRLAAWMRTTPLRRLVPPRDWNSLVSTYLGYGAPFPQAALDRLLEVSSGGQSDLGGEEEPWNQGRALHRLADTLGGPNGREGALRLLVYSKYWLRVRQPLLAVEHLEAEITFLRGLLAPALLGIAVLALMLIPGPLGPAWASVAGVVLFVATIFIFRQIERLRAVEPLDAARNCLLAEAYEGHFQSSTTR
ncbi:MAG: hypothetical protein ACRDHO_10775 [Actinomycetota bacterium]